MSAVNVARLDYDTSGLFDRDDFVAHCRVGLARMKATQHCVTNHVIEVDGDHARSTSYVIAQHVRNDDVTFTLGGTYHDDFVRSGTEWRIASRRFVTSWQAGPAARLTCYAMAAKRILKVA